MGRNGLKEMKVKKVGKMKMRCPLHEPPVPQGALLAGDSEKCHRPPFTMNGQRKLTSAAKQSRPGSKLE